MNNKWKLFYNPFEWIAGWKAFVVGIIIVCITVLIGHVGNTYFYGIQVKHIPNISLPIAILLQMTGLGITVLTMYLVSIIAAKGVRFSRYFGNCNIGTIPFSIGCLGGFSDYSESNRFYFGGDKNRHTITHSVWHLRN